jgi:hypothetical protein
MLIAFLAAWRLAMNKKSPRLEVLSDYTKLILARLYLLSTIFRLIPG